MHSHLGLRPKSAECCVTWFSWSVAKDFYIYDKNRYTDDKKYKRERNHLGLYELHDPNKRREYYFVPRPLNNCLINKESN